MAIVSLSQWDPFKLDALGLVTLFGAKEMNTSIGNLTESKFTEWLPILGSYAVANNEIAEPEQGFVLYNITDGIMATDVSSWFTRWLTSYPITYSATTIHLKTNDKPVPTARTICSLLIGLFTCGLLLIMTIMTADWWGVANVTALCLNVLIRQQMVLMLCLSVNKAMEDLADNPGPDVKVFLTLPNGKAVTILGPRQVLVGVILTDPHPLQPKIYFFWRAAAWGAFGTHAVSLGMTTLFNQILSIVALLSSTYLTAIHVGDRREAIGKSLWLEVEMGDPSWSRGPAYARMAMSEAEEQSMVSWGLMPQRSNIQWWKRYRDRYPETCTKQQGGLENGN
ncbi:hypothetical protein MANI_004194 [Metarhizium anisopliae]